MPQLTNVTISKVFEGKHGTSTKDDKSWDWIAYNFYVKDREERFSYFQSGNKPTPQKGMEIVLLEYDVEQAGEYTNYNVKKMTLPEGASTSSPTQKPSAQQQPRVSTGSGDRRDLTMYASYSKDAGIALLPYVTQLQTLSLQDFCSLIMDTGIAMWEKAHGVDAREQNAEPESTTTDEVTPLTDIPKGNFATKVPVSDCPLDANEGDPVATIYCSSQCKEVATCMGFRAAMSRVPNIPIEDDIPF